MALITKSSTKAKIAALQAGLTNGGFSTQGVDGIWGAHTQAALDAYHDSVGKRHTPYADDADQASLGVTAGAVSTPSYNVDTSNIPTSQSYLPPPVSVPAVATAAAPIVGTNPVTRAVMNVQQKFAALSTPAKVAVAGGVGVGILALVAKGGRKKKGLLGGLKSLSGLPVSSSMGALPIIGALTLGKAVALAAAWWVVRKGKANAAKKAASTATTVNMNPLAPDDPGYFNQDDNGLSPYTTRQSSDYIAPSTPNYVPDVAIPGSDGSIPTNPGMTVTAPDAGMLPGTPAAAAAQQAASGGYQKPTVSTGVPNGSTTLVPSVGLNPAITTSMSIATAVRSTTPITVSPTTTVKSTSIALRGTSFGGVTVRSPFHLDRLGGRYGAKRVRR